MNSSLARPLGFIARRAQIAGPLIGTQIAFLLSGFVPFALVLATPDPTDAALGPLVVVVLAGLRYAWMVGAGQQRLMEMSFWLYSYVFLGLAPTVQLRLGVEPSTTPDLPTQLFGETSLIALIGILSVGLGMYLRRQQSPADTNAIARAKSLDVIDGRVKLIAFASLVVMTYFISRIGAGPILENRDALEKQAQLAWPDATQRAFVRGAVSMVPLVAFVSLLQLRRQRAAEGRSGIMLLPIVVGAALLFTINPISSARYAFGTIALGMLAALGAYATPRRFRTVAAGALVALLLVFPIAGSFRHGTPAADQSLNPLASLTSGDFDSYAQISNTVLYVERHGTAHGEQALGVALFWLPRQLWRDKPPDTGILLADSRRYPFTNLSAPLWAELYINGGWIFLALGMLGLGYLIRAWDDRNVACLRRDRAPSVLACVLPFYGIILLRGSLLQAMASLAVIVAASIFVTGRRRAARGLSIDRLN